MSREVIFHFLINRLKRFKRCLIICMLFLERADFKYDSFFFKFQLKNTQIRHLPTKILKLFLFRMETYILKISRVLVSNMIIASQNWSPKIAKWCVFNPIFKACLRNYLSNFYFFAKNCKKCFFISSKKLFSFKKYSNFCNFSLPFNSFQIQKNKWKWNNLWCHELAKINLQM